ncbi:MAG: hypothetical protein HYY55_04025 [Candidatus Niyogibacteria bacterium]|nr:MAG: hypothetical protein HYY55_04025 [Candidatus Niyogibacteria bacterium]
MNQLVARLAGVISNGIQVSGLSSQEFPESRWREAILFFLFGIWSDRQSVVHRPKINFGDFTLRLDYYNGEYYAYGYAEVPQEPPALGPDDLVETSGRQADVEVALIRFVKNDRIRQLRLCVVCDQKVRHAQLVLWKKARRGEYGCAGIGLPYTWGTRGPVWM